MTCSGCGADASRRASGEPCPNCGATARIGSLSATITATSSLTAVASVGYSATPTWERQWLDLRSAHDAIKGYYTGTSMNIHDSARMVHDGCQAASSLAEYLPAVAAGTAFRNKDLALRGAADLSSTWRHAGRKEKCTKGRIAARPRTPRRDPRDRTGVHRPRPVTSDSGRA